MGDLKAIVESIATKGPEDVKNLSTRSLPEELQGLTPTDLDAFLTVLDAHLRSIHQEESGALREKTPAEQDAFSYGLALREKVVRKIEEHRQISEVFRRKPEAVQRAIESIKSHSSSPEDPYGDVRRLSAGEARDRALRVMERDRLATAHLADDQKTQIERMMRSDPNIARRIIVTENEDYRTAWMKLVTEPHPFLEPEEIRAVRAWQEFRAASETTTTAGGFGIPVFIDPSIILTAQGSSNPFLALARQVTVNTNQWKGVSSGGVSWSFQTEAATVSDNAATMAQPIVLVHMARGFIPYSIEVGEDYPAFASEMSTLLASGYDELLVEKFTTGTGSSEPFGILTSLSASASVRVTVTTVGEIGAPDPYKVWKAVPQRFRRNASWVMSVGVNNAIRQIGAANVYHGYTVNMPEAWADQLFNRPVYESAYMPDTTTSNTAPEGQAIVGDFNNFVIARNGGMSVELLPQLFQQVTAGTGPAVPTGQRGWFAYARIGSKSVNDNAFRLLVNS
jgi:HK97 family phage major capsid protein